MVPVPTSYLTVPVFGSGASNIQPEGSTYAGGFLPGQLFPAEYENWLMNRLTTNSLASQTTNLSVAAEIVNILNQASIIPDPVSTTQLYSALNALYATVSALSSEASTRSSADTTLQSNINAEATARMNADISVAATAANANNLSSGTVPVARLANITTAQLAASAGILSTQMAAGNKFSYFDGGTASGNVTFPTIEIGETAILWYTRTSAGSFQWIFPATGTFDLDGIGIKMSVNPGISSIGSPNGSSSALYAGHGVSGGATITDGGTGGTQYNYRFILTRTA